MKEGFKSYLQLRNIISFSILNYGQAALGFLVTFLLAKYLAKDEFGYYTYGLVFMNGVMVLSLFGMDKTLVRDLVQSKERQEELMKSSTVFKSIIGLIVIACVTLYLYFGEKDHYKIFVALITSGIGLLAALRAKEWYDFRGRIMEHAWITLIERAIFVIVVGFILYFLGGFDALAYVLMAYLIIRAASVVYEWWRSAIAFSSVIILFRQFRSAIIRNNAWIWLAAIGNLLMSQVNQLMLEGESGVKQLASYGLAFQVVQLIRILQGQILRLATPQIASVTLSHDRKTILNGLWSMSFLSLGCTFVLAIPFYFALPVIIDALLGPEYLDMIPIFNVLLVWTLFYGVALINNQFLVSLHLQKAYFASTLIFGVLSIFLANYFIGRYDGQGAALSLLISHGGSILAQMAIVLWFVYRNEKTA